MNTAKELESELIHLLNVYDWLKKIKPKATAPLVFASLLHDCDRLFPSKRIRESDFSEYEEYKRAHARNCATIAVNLLTRAGVKKSVVEKTKRLVEDHECGTTPDSYALMAADSLSFFTVNIEKYRKRRGTKATIKKVAFMYNRLKQKERKMLASVKPRKRAQESNLPRP